MGDLKKTKWVGSALKDLKHFPEAVKDSVGYALHKIQAGLVPKNVKPLKGFTPAVMEIVVDHQTNTYRAVYTVKIGQTVYILHCFQKKSTQGIKTPKKDIELIKQRLYEAQMIAKAIEEKNHAYES